MPTPHIDAATPLARSAPSRAGEASALRLKYPVQVRATFVRLPRRPGAPPAA